jgi:hypothetical protein
MDTVSRTAFVESKVALNDTINCFINLQKMPKFQQQQQQQQQVGLERKVILNMMSVSTFSRIYG